MVLHGHHVILEYAMVYTQVLALPAGLYRITDFLQKFNTKSSYYNAQSQVGDGEPSVVGDLPTFQTNLIFM